MTEYSTLSNPDDWRFRLSFDERVARLPDDIRVKFEAATVDVGSGVPRGPVPNLDGAADLLDTLRLVEDIHHRMALGQEEDMGHKTRDGRFHTWVSDNRISPKSGKLAASIMGLDYQLFRRDQSVGDGYYLEHDFIAPKSE